MCKNSERQLSFGIPCNSIFLEKFQETKGQNEFDITLCIIVLSVDHENRYK